MLSSLTFEIAPERHITGHRRALPAPATSRAHPTSLHHWMPISPQGKYLYSFVASTRHRCSKIASKSVSMLLLDGKSPVSVLPDASSFERIQRKALPLSLFVAAAARPGPRGDCSCIPSWQSRLNPTAPSTAQQFRVARWLMSGQRPPTPVFFAVSVDWPRSPIEHEASYNWTCRPKALAGRRRDCGKTAPTSHSILAFSGRRTPWSSPRNTFCSHIVVFSRGHTVPSL
uniref:Uncharacterized protein n=1 Tax=Mycena chlorophos TaxID=658473 RepID=A0ABQ0KXQ9_MYCCL|nr:predicted protein [Mycena chlorophos]